jgi:succinate dehydrogenase/fumarate reductase flavoprotein subunit
MSKDEESESVMSRNQSAKENEMAEEKDAPRRISRKDFVKGAAALAGAGALVSCGPAATPAPAETPEPCPTCPPAAECTPCAVPGVPETWDEEADVVIVGYGGAGAVAAVTAHDAGAKVLLLEKAPQGKEGGNTRVSGNVWFCPTNVDDAVKYLTAMGGGMGFPIPADMIQAWAEKMVDNDNWVTSIGGEVLTREPVSEPEFPDLPGSACFPGYHYVGPAPSTYTTEGGPLWRLLKDNVAKRGIEVWQDSPAKELVQDGVTKEILGVVAEKEGNKAYIKAKKAVLLCCGGFENNQEMIQDYLHWQCGYPKGTPYNTGDGIKMAMAVGADLWHMDNVAGPDFNFKPPEWDFAFGYRIGPGAAGWIVVGKDNKRFVDDKVATKHGKVLIHDTYVECPEPLPMHMIFDETTRLAGPLYANKPPSTPPGGNSWFSSVEQYEWSSDSSKEIAAGWITKADTIGELAAKIARDPDALEETVNKYNEYCAAGEDPDYGTPKEKLVPIETPPFYAMEMVPTFTNTQGGPRHDKNAQVLDTEGKPIPRLYAAGELGSIYSHCYQGGGNNAESIAFGRIAGENAAAEEPWA